MTVRLALFDCDGTLADSQHDIVTAMARACADHGVAAPPAQAVRTSIGLSVERALATLLPGLDNRSLAAVADRYRHHFRALRTAAGAAPEPLYPGIVPLLDRLLDAGWTLGIATGKSRRGLDRLLAAHGIADRFKTLQTADVHPSKPHPAMLDAALHETGATPDRAVVIGDTAFDIAMAAALGVRAIGVSWGYHPAAELVAAGANALVDDAAALADLLETMR